MIPRPFLLRSLRLLLYRRSLARRRFRLVTPHAPSLRILLLLLSFARSRFSLSPFHLFFDPPSFLYSAAVRAFPLLPTASPPLTSRLPPLSYTSFPCQLQSDTNGHQPAPHTQKTENFFVARTSRWCVAPVHFSVPGLYRSRVSLCVHERAFSRALRPPPFDFLRPFVFRSPPCPLFHCPLPYCHLCRCFATHSNHDCVKKST